MSRGDAPGWVAPPYPLGDAGETRIDELQRGQAPSHGDDDSERQQVDDAVGGLGRLRSRQPGQGTVPYFFSLFFSFFS